MPDRRISLAIPCLLTYLAFGLRLHLLAGQSLWFDEGFALHLASKTLPQIVEQNPVGWLPLHSVALHFWLELVGESPFTARFFSLFFGVLVVAVLYLLGKELASPTTGVIASLLGCFSPFLVYYSQEARVYALWLFLSLLSVYLLLRALRSPECLRWWLAYAAATTLAIYSHYFSVFLVPWGVIALVREAVRTRRWRMLVWGGRSPIACRLVVSTADWLCASFSSGQIWFLAQSPVTASSGGRSMVQSDHWWEPPVGSGSAGHGDTRSVGDRRVGPL